MQRGIIVFLFVFLSVNFVNQTSANQTDTSQEELLKRSVISLLVPIMKTSFIKYYGPKGSTQFYCEKIVNIKQPSSEKGSNYFEIEMEAITFEGPHAPPHDLINVKFTNFPSGEWNVKDFHTKRLTNKEALTYKCN